VKPASRPKMRKTPIRSCEPSVVRWRLMASLARVMAVEKPMQYSVPWTSLSMVLGTATSLTPWSARTWLKLRVSSAADRDEVVQAELLDVLEDHGCEVVDALLDLELLEAIRADVGRVLPASSCGRWSGRCEARCRRFDRSNGC